MIAEYDCGSFSGHRLGVTEEEVIIAGLKIPVSSILDVVIFPISGNLRGLGGCIKSVTEDNPELPVMNSQRGWDVIYQGEVNSGFDLARGNCFWFGGDYSENGWIAQNKKAEEIVSIVKGMLPPHEETASAAESGYGISSEFAEKEEEKEAIVQIEKKKSFFEKLLGKKK